MVNQSIIQSVYRLKYKSETGTCFHITISGKKYLITAKHIFSNINNKELVKFEIFHNNKWRESEGQILIHSNGKIDIAVIDLKTTSFLTNTNIEIANYGELFASQDCYFLGFPYNIYSEIPLVNNNFPIPFIKKAIFSLFSGTESKEKIYYLDGHNNPGFSGGPVVANILPENKLKICSIVSAYIVQSNKLEQTNLAYGENSGIIVTYSAQHIKEIINEK